MDDGHGSSPFLIFRRRQPCMVLDLHTRSLYILPVPKHPIDLAVCEMVLIQNTRSNPIPVERITISSNLP